MIIYFVCDNCNAFSRKVELGKLENLRKTNIKNLPLDCKCKSAVKSIHIYSPGLKSFSLDDIQSFFGDDIHVFSINNGFFGQIAKPNNPMPSNLRRLSLNCNSISSIDSWVDMLPLTRIEVLRLNDNLIESIDELVNVLPRSNIESLSLNNNKIINATPLWNVLNETKLVVVSLSGNMISDVSMLLQKVQSNHRIESVNLRNNLISDADVNRLVDIIPRTIRFVGFGVSNSIINTEQKKRFWLLYNKIFIVIGCKVFKKLPPELFIFTLWMFFNGSL